MKKITRVFLCMTMSFCVSFVYSQQESVPDTIWNEEDFWAMSPDGNYIQMVSFTLTDSNRTIGENMTEFTGSYDGNGNGIGCSIERNYPLFPPISGTVKNLVVHNTTVKGVLDNSGIITSHLKEGGLIDHVMLSYIGIYNGKNTGGIAGFMDGGTIRFSSVASITVTDTVELQDSKGGGGIVGYMKKGKIYNCSAAYGGYHPNAVAGIVGLVDNSDNSDTTVIESCWWSSLVQDSVFQGLTVGLEGHPGTMSAIANVLHADQGNVTIKHCYAKTLAHMPVSATDNVANDIPVNCYSQETTDFTYSQLVDSLNYGMDVPSFFLLNDTTISLNRGELMYTTRDGSFRNDSTWGGYSYYPSILQEIHIRHQLDIPRGETMIIPAYADVIVTDEGWTTIEDGANLLLCGDEREITNVKVKKNLTGNEWNFVGFPNVESVSPLANVDYDIWALPFDYASNAWSEDHFLHWNSQVHDTVSRGNGIFVWPENDGEVTAETDGIHIEKNIVVTKDIQGSLNGNGYWMALANPYLGKLEVAKFVNDNTGRIQGRIVYLYNGTSFNTQETIPTTVPVGEGFFVNMVSNGIQTIDFKPSQMVGYPSTEAKTVAREREYVIVSVSTDGYKVPVMICQNDLASEEYDIFDANKMFGNGSVAEPYFVTEGINLCKEEIKSMPYYATMNIKSGEARRVEIVADAIPEGYSATLIDGDEEVELTEGMVYTTDIASGENAERFKLLIGDKNVSLEDVEAVENLIRVSNTGRRVNISAQGAIEAEVYNALGQKVYSTTDNSFTLDGVSAGAYVIKVSNGKSVKSEKIIVQ